MAAVSGIWNHVMGMVNPLANDSSSTSASGSSGSSDDTASTISANDFLTLLVTEMQNQDPTADTDPNEYINQLVQVNSLEQLIDINQNLSAALGGSGSSGSSGSGSTNGGVVQSPHASTAVSVAGSSTSDLKGAGSAASPQAVSQANHSQIAAGNLSVPDATPAALRVAQALSGQPGRQ